MFILFTMLLGFIIWNDKPVSLDYLVLIISFIVLIVLSFSYRFSNSYLKDLRYDYKVITEEQVTAKIEDKDHPSVTKNVQSTRKELPESNRNAHRYWLILGNAKYRVSRGFYKLCSENEIIEIHKAKFSESIFVIKKADTDKYQVLFPE
ncbi:MAG: hypothetical protein HND52_10300 [Ignavibacteriae bacterium]|nr:hypothetical protein [Ignavibacteriota bacterium]NOG98339.1 hypothetical protein [Ignavibacteriota bacterium]